jgi:hypothetical protein
MTRIKRSFGIPLAVCLLVIALWLVLARKPADQPRQAVVTESEAPAADASTSKPWSGPEGAEMFAKAVQSATKEDWERLVREALASGNPDILRDTLPALLRQWIETDIRGFLAFLHSLEVLDPSGELWAVLGPVLLGSLPELNDQAASSPTIRSIIQRAILNTARTNPQLALQWAREWLDGTALDSALSGIVLYLVKEDMPEAQRLTQGIVSVPSRLAATLAIGEFLGASNPIAAMDWARSLPRAGDRAYALSAVLSVMAKKTPEETGTIYREIVSAMQEEFTSRLIAERKQQPGSLESEFEGLTQEEALRALLAVPDPNVQYFHRAAFEIAASMALNNPEGALDWAHGISAQQGGTSALAGVYREWALRDGNAAWTAFQNETNPAPEVASQFFLSWALSDPVQASQAIDSLPGGLVRDAAIPALVSGWVDGGGTPESIGRWADNLQNASDRDQAFAAIATSSAFADPISAWNQIRKIEDPKRQNTAFAEVFPSLADSHPQVAKQAVQSLALPEVQKEYFLSLLEPAQSE